MERRGRHLLPAAHIEGHATHVRAFRAGTAGRHHLEVALVPHIERPSVGVLDQHRVHSDLIAIAGRVAKAVIAETPGVFRPSWSIEQVGEDLTAIRDMHAPLVFPVVPDGHVEHLRYSFSMAAQEAPHA